MTQARKRRAAAPAMGQQMMELACAVPQVVAHRVTRMALAGPTPSPRDRREFQRMGNEKVLAFQQSWVAMLTQAALGQQRLALAMMQAWMWPWGGGGPAASAWLQEGQAVLHKGLAPVHRRAVANAKRLRGTPLR
jgi:hypothetical protein